MCRKAIKTCLPLLKCVSDWFVISKMLKYLDNFLIFKFFNLQFFNDDLVHDNVTFFSDDMGLVNVELNNVNLDDDNFDQGVPEILERNLHCFMTFNNK